MADLPPIVIVFQTFERTSYALQAIASVKENLHYPGGFTWIVADDGSPEPHVEAVKAAIGSENIFALSSERRGYGGTANWAWETSFTVKASPLTLWLEDDWIVPARADITAYAEILLHHPDIAMVRLAHLPIGLDCKTIGRHHRMFLHIQATTDYMFSGNPSLRHTRFFSAFGWYPEGHDPGRTEIEYDFSIRKKGSEPKIIRPVDLATWGIFGHIGEVRSYG